LSKKPRAPSIELGHVGKPKVTRIQVAVFQLETAIELWFSEKDLASIITLAFAAHEIIYKLNKALPKAQVSVADPDQAPAGYSEEWHKIFRLDSYFCKHGGSDPLEAHYLSVDALPYVLLDALLMYKALGFHRRLYFYLLEMWFLTIHPEIFKIPAKDNGLSQFYIEQCRAMGRNEYFKLGREHLAADGAAPWSPVVHPQGLKP
jgi:hypothetical protein